MHLSEFLKKYLHWLPEGVRLERDFKECLTELGLNVSHELPGFTGNVSSVRRGDTLLVTPEHPAIKQTIFLNQGRILQCLKRKGWFLRRLG